MEVQPLFSAAGVAALLDVKVGTVLRLGRARPAPSRSTGRRAVRFDRDEILAWIKGQRVSAEAAS